MSSIRQETINGVKWSTIENISSTGLSFIIGLVLARILTPSDFGIIGMVSLFFAVSQILINSGFGNALIRKPDRTETDCSTVFYFNLFVGIICSLLIFCLSPYIANFFNQPILSPICKILSITLVLNSLAIVPVAILTIKVDFKSLAKVTVMSTCISGSLGIFLAYKGAGIWSLVTQQIGNVALRGPLVWIVSKWRPRSCFSINSFQTMFSYGSKLLASGLIQTIYTNASAIVIGKFYQPADLGFYSRGNSIAQAPVTNLSSAIQRVSFPILAKLQNDEQALIRAYRKYIKLSSIPIFIIMTTIAVVARPLVLLILTDKWVDAIAFIQIFCVAYIFDHITKLNLNLLQVIGRSDLFFRLELIKKAVAFIILIASIPFGVFAICLSKIVYTQFALVVNTYYTGKIFGIGYVEQMKDYIKYLAASIASCLFPYVISQSCFGGTLFSLIISVVIAFLSYAFLLRDDSLFREFLGVLLEKIKK